VTQARLLVVNADDLGYDPEIDRGILEAHRRGIVTCATAMVDTPFSADALRGAPASLGIGLHAVIDPGLGRAGAEAVLRRQLARFEELRGAAPTHLDSHKHVHARPEILAAFAAVAAPRRLPVRAVDAAMRRTLRARGVVAADAFLGDASLRPAWTREALAASLAAVGEGITELMAHPGHAPSHARTSFGAEREIELEALCDPRARAAVDRAGIRLCRWADICADVAGRAPGG
jgi:predicted glycoside hydrolase/deacetylase ChbG (UPF0249 family)